MALPIKIFGKDVSKDMYYAKHISRKFVNDFSCNTREVDFSLRPLRLVCERCGKDVTSTNLFRFKPKPALLPNCLAGETQKNLES